MASFGKKTKRRRELRDDRLAKQRQKKTRVRERKQKEAGELFISDNA